jgi:hypothetical protein
MSKCKVCELIPDNPRLLADITDSALSSRAVAEKWAQFGKTTVNKHRTLCAGKPQEATGDLQEVIWSGDKGELRTGALSSDIGGKTHEEILREFGHDPDKVEIATVLWEKHRQYWSVDLNKMLWKHSYSFGLVKKQEKVTAEIVDAVALMNSIEAKSRPVVAQNGGTESTFCLDWADWQMAKLEGGGSAGLIERLQNAFDLAEERIGELRTIGRKLNELVIFGGGDMVEGCVIYPNQSYEIDDHRRGQIKNTVAMIIKGIKQLAPHFDTVRVVVVPGNHGEHRINGNRTTIGDNDDLLVFEMAQLGIESDPAFKHVSFEIADREISITTKVQGWTYGLTHGDVYGKTGGTGIRNKVFNWFKTMAGNRHPVGQSDVLLTHHFHHDALEDWGATLWVQNPTMDGGSHYFKEATGHDTKPGMNSWVVTQTERFQDKQVLR